MSALHILPIFLSYLMLVGWIILGFFALFELRKYKISSIAKALWTIIIVIIPLVGALAFLIVNPSDPV